MCISLLTVVWMCNSSDSHKRRGIITSKSLSGKGDGRIGRRIDLGYEQPNIPYRLDRPSMGVYQKIHSSRKARWPTTHSRHEGGHQRYPLHSSRWLPVANAATHLPEVEECV